jgi:phenylalanyl-tRNA synthetase alpha chain
MSADTRDLDALERQAQAEIAAAETLQGLTEARARYLGRKGSLSALLRAIGALQPEERARRGQQVNAAKQRIEARVAERRAALEGRARQSALAQRQVDISLPGAAAPAGHLHPLTHVTRDMVGFFTSLGFSIEEGPEVETDYHNFEALNIPPEHPARDEQDTFYVEGGNLLRTHTSNVQIRTMTGRTPPFRFIAPGRHLMGEETQLRFRANHFPFTEPSAEMDVRWGDEWLEWGGCGMIHPRVLERCGIDPEQWQGFAFGMGIDRTVLHRYGIPALRILFEGDVRVLEQI